VHTCAGDNYLNILKKRIAVVLVLAVIREGVNFRVCGF
jgi:hypothetical protein